MGLKTLAAHTYFNLEGYLENMKIAFVKVEVWQEEDEVLGTKVRIQVMEDKNQYKTPYTTNCGEQLIIKVRKVPPESYQKFKSLVTEVEVTDIERASIYGEWRNQLSVIAVVKPKGVQGNE